MAKLRTDTGDSHHIRPLWLWMAVLLVAFAAISTAAAQQVAPNPPATAASVANAGPTPAESLAAATPADKVVDVKIRGNKSLALDKILPHIRTRPGRPFDLDLIEEDVRRLDHTHMFVNVKTFWQQVEGGRIVIFDVLERPLLSEVLFVGCSEIRKKTLQKEAELKKGDPVDPFAIEEARRKLEEFYHKRGFTGARIVLLEGDKATDRRAVFLINEGTKQRVWKTEFIGNTIASGDRLKTQIKSKPPFLYLFKGELDRKEVDDDLDRLTAYYRGLGFFRARIGRELEFNEKENWVTVTFVIDEGPRYKVRNVAVNGNTKYTNDVLLADLKLKDGEYFNQAKMTADQNSLQDKYGGIGYVFTDIKADPRFLEEPGQLDLVYNIKEGDRYRVGKINVDIKGEYPHTQITTILNRLSLKPGDIVDVREIRQSERRIRASGLFESNPASGNAPKIVFNAPDQDPNQEQVAERPSKPGKKPGSKFRGQSPDSPSGDRELDLTLDCGRYIGPQGNEEQNGKVRRADQQDVTTQGATAGLPSSAVNTVGQTNSAAVHRTRVSDELSQMAKEYGSALSQQRQPKQSHARLIETQYSPNGGQVNPATTGSERQDRKSEVSADLGPLLRPQTQTKPASQGGWVPWWGGSASNASNSTSAPMPPNTTTAATQTAAAGPATEQSSPAQAAPTQTTPAQPAPAYGQNMWPRPADAPERPVDSPEGRYAPGPIFSESSPFRDGPPDGGEPMRNLDLNIKTEETMTGRLMFGVGINSDAGLVGSVVLDEQNFDWTRVPSSWEEVRNATAWRGAGQRFRIEAVPGTQVQRYMVNFQEPYMFNTAVSMGLSGYYYNRIYTEYTEQRLGGRVAFGYQLTPDLSGSIAYRGAKINITNPIDPWLPALAEVTGRDLALHGFQLSLTHDKRDNAFLATEGHLIEASVEQVLGSFNYPRAELDLRKYFTLYERPDGSGRQVLSLGGHVGYTGDSTPIYDRFFAGGFSTIRGFQFRGASPQEVGPSTGQDIVVGGNFEVLASAEYLFPITADDMLRGVVFCDTGTVEPNINNWSNKYRVAPGFGLRIVVPAMGPAPIALDFAFPISWQPGDRSEMFSFFMGFGR